MERKIVFLDVDGTLCDFAGRVPESARAAIGNAARKGHQFYLCTGRSLPEIHDYILDLDLAGIIGAGGGYVEVGGEVLLHKVFEREPLLELLAYLRKNKVAYFLESNHGTFASKNVQKIMIKQARKQIPEGSKETEVALENMQHFIDQMEFDETRVDYDNVNKLTFINETIPFEEIERNFKDQFNIMHSSVPLHGEESGEIGIKGVHKQTAIEFLLEYLQVDRKDTFAFGDGNNDLEMFAAVQTAIAMENAVEPLLAVADDITKTPEEDGIALALTKYGLVDEADLVGCLSEKNKG